MKRIFLPLLILLTTSCEIKEPTYIRIKNTSHECILYNASINYPKFYPTGVGQSNQTPYAIDAIKSGDKLFVTFFDCNMLYRKWLANDSSIYGLGYFNYGGTFDEAILAIYCVDYKWLIPNRLTITYPCYGDSTITYFESIDGKETIRRDGYFGEHYENLK